MRNGVAFVVNPASGRGKGLRLWERLEPKASELGLFEVRLTERPRHGVELARAFAEESWPRIIAVGGDGTLNEVLNGAIASESAIGCVPLGTGNDWVRTVGIPSDPFKALEIAFRGKDVPSDAGYVEEHGWFLNVMGAGFDAEVVQRISEAKGLLTKLGPTPRYVASVLSTFIRYRPPTIRIALDGKENQVPKTLLVAVGVAQYYGSGMKVLPLAQIDDGVLDVVWGSDVRMRELPGLVKKIFRGEHVSHPKVIVGACSDVVLDSDTKVPFHLDGDVRGFLPVRVSVRKHAVRVVVPSP